MNDSEGFREGQKIVSLFDQGKRFTEELLKENERLRKINQNLLQDNRKLSHEMGEEGILQLKEKVALLEREKADLTQEVAEYRKETESMEEENREFADRYIEVERQNSDLISMYVASYQLHSTLNYDEVVKTVKDITINMMGGEVFGVYLLDSAANRLVMIAHEGMEGREDGIPIDDGPIADVLQSGDARFVETKPEYTDGDVPVAYLPLQIGDDPFGIIVIYKLLIQKEGFRTLDFELVELLGKHAASAIYSAKLHTATERKQKTLQGFVDLIKWEHENPDNSE